jgi:hypothetical protein
MRGEEIEVTEDDRTVRHGHSPLFRDVHNPQEESLKDSLNTGKGGLAARIVAQGGVKALDYIDRIHHSPDGRGKIEQPLDMFEIVNPYPHGGWVLSPF